jgi:hypothetical protein
MRRLALLGAALIPWTGATAQHGRAGLRLDGQVVAALSAMDPTPGARGAATELRLIHPLLMVRGGTSAGHAQLLATVNLEGATIPQGTLAFGVWGEGFVDRRHPHTYLHELMLVLRRDLGPVDGVVAAGKGFVPFGTDDPMTRPTLRYPVNHHLSQILERALVLAATGTGPVLLEAALFNGDEPEGPRGWPNLSRFADSWALRLTVHPGAGLELSGSHAQVRSPEHRAGAGPLEYKWSAAARWSGPMGRGDAYALVEWARTTSGGGAVELDGMLLEAALSAGPQRPYVRVEMTERPEEERLSDYRTVRPPRVDGVLGVTRWTIVTAGYGVTAVSLGSLRLRPFIEASLGHAARVSGALDPVALYGGSTLRSITAGVQMTHGLGQHRMGRYTESPGGGHHR